MREKSNFSVLLHNIRSAYNVGSIFRTADAICVEHLYLTGYTPAPIDGFGNKRLDIQKTALGAQNKVSWSKHASVGKLILDLKKEGFFIVGVEQSAFSVDYKKFKVSKRKSVFIFGNEVRGVSKQTLLKCDEIIEIPMKGFKESLNVSVSVGIVLFGIFDN